MQQMSKTAVARVQVADAIAKVREAISFAEDQEMHHAERAEAPCHENHSAEDAAFRHALLTSEDAMISVLESLPLVSKSSVAFIN